MILPINLMLNPTYPTPEKIMEKEIKFKKETVKIVKDWKKANFKGWKTKSNEEKISKIIELLESLKSFYQINPLTFDGSAGIYSFMPTEKIINLDHNNPSIISSLHEFAHALLGASETKACRWSVWLFKKLFHKSFQKLTFQGHVLIRKPKES